MGASDAIQIVDQRKADSKSFTIIGTLKNVSSEHWNRIELEIKVYVEELQVNYCKGNYVLHVKPGETREFSAGCPDAYGGAWPASLRYELSVNPSGSIASHPDSPGE